MNKSMDVATSMSGNSSIDLLSIIMSAVDGNSMVIEAAPQLTVNTVIRSSVLVIMSIASVIGNSWTIRNIRKSRVAKKLSNQNYTAIYALITHLCVADFLVASFCMFGDAVWALTVQWLAGEFM